MATTTESKTDSSDYVYPHITKIPGVCGGRSAIDHTRVRVVDIVFLQREGYTGKGYGIHWPKLDEDISVRGLFGLPD